MLDDWGNQRKLESRQHNYDSVQLQISEVGSGEILRNIYVYDRHYVMPKAYLTQRAPIQLCMANFDFHIYMSSL